MFKDVIKVQCIGAGCPWGVTIPNAGSDLLDAEPLAVAHMDRHADDLESHDSVDLATMPVIVIAGPWSDGKAQDFAILRCDIDDLQD